MLDKPRGQGALVSRGEAQSGPRPQLDDQFGRRVALGQFDLHKVEGGRGLGLALAPAAERGLVDPVLTGECGGGQAAGGESGQELGALGRVGARTAAGTRGGVHAPDVYHVPTPQTRVSPKGRLPLVC